MQHKKIYAFNIWRQDCHGVISEPHEGLAVCMAKAVAWRPKILGHWVLVPPRNQTRDPLPSLEQHGKLTCLYYMVYHQFSKYCNLILISWNIEKNLIKAYSWTVFILCPSQKKKKNEKTALILYALKQEKRLVLVYNSPSRICLELGLNKPGWVLPQLQETAVVNKQMAFN